MRRYDLEVIFMNNIIKNMARCGEYLNWINR